MDLILIILVVLVILAVVGGFAVSPWLFLLIALFLIIGLLYMRR